MSTTCHGWTGVWKVANRKQRKLGHKLIWRSINNTANLPNKSIKLVWIMNWFLSGKGKKSGFPGNGSVTSIHIIIKVSILRYANSTVSIPNDYSLEYRINSNGTSRLSIKGVYFLKKFKILWDFPESFQYWVSHIKSYDWFWKTSRN